MRPATRAAWVLVAALGAAEAAPALRVPAVSATYRCLTSSWAIMKIGQRFLFCLKSDDFDATQNHLSS